MPAPNVRSLGEDFPGLPARGARMLAARGVSVSSRLMIEPNSNDFQLCENCAKKFTLSNLVLSVFALLPLWWLLVFVILFAFLWFLRLPNGFV